MALKRPTPKKLSAAAQQAVIEGSQQQTGKTNVVKSYDPAFPVFDVPVNQKLLVYIPNHTVVGADGSVNMRMDKFAAHPIIDGRTFGNARCSQGIMVDELGLNGTCPLCDGVSECWDLYRNQYRDIAKSRGIDPNQPEAKDLLKQESIELLNSFVIKNAEVWYTFPIVVIDCEEKDGVLTLTPKKDADGRISGKPMFYSIRERTFKDKWEAGYDSIDTDDGLAPTSPAGLWAILNFTYQPKNGNPDKMGSAKNLKVTFRPMSAEYDQWATYFDQLTADWTPEKAQEVVVLDVLRDMNEQKELADTLLKPVREKLALYSLSGVNPSVGTAPAVPTSTNADNALANFGATPVASPTAEMPNLTAEVENVGVAPPTM